MRELKDYEKRFVEEYHYIDEKGRKLGDIIWKYERGTLDFEPKCSIELLTTQLNIMAAYLSILEERARIEDIPLDNE